MPTLPNGEAWTCTQRVRWMGNPVLFACVAALVVNDHVLKDRWGGSWTGKLSDFAGLAMVGIVLAAAIGVTRGLAVVAAAFALLKLVPGVAEAAAPLLGGVTRRDHTDLVALTILVPIWLMLRPGTPAADATQPFASARPSSIWARVRTTLAAVAPIVGVVFATAATTATSCGPRPAVVTVTAEGNGLYALVTTGGASDRWAISEDGGSTWRGSEPPTTGSGPFTHTDWYEDPGPTGQQEACNVDGTCWRLRDRRTIERLTPNGSADQEFHLTESEFSDISTGCAGGSIGVLASIAMADGDVDAPVVAGLGADGVVVRQDDGGWERVRVLSAPPVEADRAETAASRALLLFGPVLALAVWLIGPSRWPSVRTGLAVTAAGWLASIVAAGAIGFLAGPDTDEARVIWRVALPGMILTTAAAIIVARRPARPRPLSSNRPPPLPPPPPPTSPATGDDG